MDLSVSRNSINPLSLCVHSLRQSLFLRFVHVDVDLHIIIVALQKKILSTKFVSV